MGIYLANPLAIIERLADRLSAIVNVGELFLALDEELENLSINTTYCFYLFDEAENRLRISYAKRLSEAEKVAAENTAMERYPGNVYRTGDFHYIPDHISKPDLLNTETEGNSKMRSILYLPVRCRGKIIGVFCIKSELPNVFNDSYVAALKVIVSFIAEIMHSMQKKQTIDAKSRENEKLTAFVKNTTNAVLYTDTEHLITWVNNRFEVITGYTLKEVVGKKASSFLIGKNTENEKVEELQNAINSYSAHKTVVTVYDKNGFEFKLAVNVAPVIDDGGEPTGFIIVLQDVTEEERLKKKTHGDHDKLKRQLGDIVSLKDRFRALIENTSDLVISLDEKGTILFVNDTWLSKTGYAIEDVLHTSIFNYLHPDSREQYSILFGILQEHPMERTVGYSIMDKLGQVVELEGRVVTRFKGGKLHLINSYLIDRTEWNKIQRREDQYRVALRNYKNAIDSAAIVSITDRKGIINYVNEKFCEVSKYDRDELIGKSHSVINSGYHSGHFWQKLWSTIAKGEIWRGEVKNKARDGSFYWVDSTIIPFMKDDVVEEYISIRHEITESVKNKQAILSQKVFYENILHNIPVDIAVFNEKHQYVFLNKEAIKNDDLRAWLIGKDDFDYGVLKGLPASFAQVRRDKFNDALISENDVVWLDRQVAPTGELRFKERRFHTYADKKTIIGYAVDITSLKLNELELERSKEELLLLNRNLETEIDKRTIEIRLSNTSLENFAYSISHDLKAPLRSIGSFADLLKIAIEKNKPVEVHQFLNFINAGVSKMTDQINALLKFSTYGTAQLSVSEFSMQAEVDKAYNLYIKLVNPRQFTFENNITASIKADKNLISAVLENLLSNAIKYSMPKNEVHIKVYEKWINDELVFCIEDKGIGFDMTYYDKIFGLFQRLHGQEVDGMGIGLSHVHRIIQRHNGKIWAESNVGIGTTFFFTLPTDYAVTVTMATKLRTA